MPDNKADTPTDADDYAADQQAAYDDEWPPLPEPWWTQR